MLPPDLLDLLRCPVSRVRLRTADDALLQRANAAIAVGKVVDRSGEIVGEPLTAGLVTEDGSRLYRIDDGIVRLLVDGAIELEQIADR